MRAFVYKRVYDLYIWIEEENRDRIKRRNVGWNSAEEGKWREREEESAGKVEQRLSLRPI